MFFLILIFKQTKYKYLTVLSEWKLNFNLKLNLNLKPKLLLYQKVTVMLL